jgi:predicted MFS family arabinose efflux permease
MMLKLLLYPIAYAVDYISNYVVSFLWEWIGLRIHGIIILSIYKFLNSFLQERYENRPIGPVTLFIFQTTQFVLLRFSSSIGAMILLGLWGHRFSWVVYLIFLVVREFYITSQYRYGMGGLTDQVSRLGNLVGAWIGSALAAVLTVIVTR